MSADDFRAKIQAKLDAETAANKKTEAMTDGTKACLELRTSLTGRSAQDLVAQVYKINVVCARAFDESKMTPAEFWSKFKSAR